MNAPEIPRDQVINRPPTDVVECQGQKSQQGRLLETELGYPVPEIPDIGISGIDWIRFRLDRWPFRRNFRTSCSLPCLDLEPLDAFEFVGVAGDEGGTQIPCLRGDEEVERADRRAFAFQVGPNPGVVAGVFDAEINHR